MKVKKKKRHIFLRIALLAFSVYIVVVLVQLQLDIDKKQSEIDALKEAIETQQMLNEDLEQQKENLDEYLEQQAWEDGYSRPGEIFITETPGAN